jgi:hypothetical protein
MRPDSKEVLARLQAEPGPVTWGKLKKEFAGKKSGVSEEELREALASDGIFAWTKPKNSYWHVDPEAQVEEEILAACRKKAMAAGDVKGASKKKAVERLVAAAKIVMYPAVEGKKQVLVAAKGGHDAYWAYVREVIETKLKKAGISEEGLEEKIWEILPRLEPERDVPLSVAKLRRSMGLTEVDKHRFDEAVIKMREQRRIHLTQHDHPLGLSAEERELLIDGKDGRYYVAITRREQ